MNGNLSARLTPESKTALRRTIRDLRERLIEELRGYATQRYLLNVPFAKAGLSQAMRERRRRLESALAERAAEDGGTDAYERAMVNAIKEAGATLLNRLVLIRHLEAVGLSRPAVVTGGWKSLGYQQFRDHSPGFIEDETQGYGTLLQLLFDELSGSLPGLFGKVGLTSLFPPSPATLRAVIEALDEVPAEAWRDDMTLGWVYQYWNDPDREALDAKLHERGKLESHEIASKTQMFTERYMVEWLLHNSLGPTWLAMCRKNGWTADVEQRGVLQSLDERRADWRKKREAGEVAPDALMPIDGALEECWKYYVPQPLPDDVVKHAPASIRELKLIDPACGSGHFLVVAFDLLAELYREEARHRGESWTDRQIAEWILENNLHGVDIDPRAVQIAAAATFLKARTLAKDASPSQVNLVAPALRLSALDRKDPALLKLERDIELETGIPPELTQQLLEVLKGVDHLGTLLKVGDAVDRAIEAYEGKLGKARRQADLFAGAEEQKRTTLEKKDAKKLILGRLNAFLAVHAGEEDLGLRLRGQQLTAGLRFASIVRDGEYHLVVANPPYQGTARMKDAGYIAKHYPRGKSDLYAAFLERGLEMCRPGGASAMVTMRSWLFLSGLTALRKHLVQTYDLRIIGDMDRGAFEEIPDEVVATTMSVFRRAAPASESSVAMQPTPLSDKQRDSNRTARKRASILTQAGRHEFRTDEYDAVEQHPLIYWWTHSRLEEYRKSQKVADVAPVRFGINTGNNARFVRRWWEISPAKLFAQRHDTSALDVATLKSATWIPFVMGGQGREWFEGLRTVLRFDMNGIHVKTSAEHNYGLAGIRWKICNEDFFFRPAISFPKIGATFSARAHRFRSAFDTAAPSVFPDKTALPDLLLWMNSQSARDVLGALNPTINFGVIDVQRLPIGRIAQSAAIFVSLERSFATSESSNEASFEFTGSAVNNWSATQKRVQSKIDAVDASAAPGAQAGDDQVSAESIEQSKDDLASLAFTSFFRSLSGGVDASTSQDGIIFVSARQPKMLPKPLVKAWRSVVGDDDTGSPVDWLRDYYFPRHKRLHENRPTIFPLCSERRSFLAFVPIHRWTDSTLSSLLAEHLLPEQRAIHGALVDLQTARNSPDKKIRSAAEKNYAQNKRWLEELEDFIRKVQEVSENGPPLPDDKTEPREADAPYRMNLDDGVMVNSAALWPLLEPMWKDPKKWWKELANAKGRKDYDWSHLAARYFPARVDEKCQQDPSLAVAHGCFWKYHPEKAYQWELRLQDEIGPDFKLDEKDSDALRAAFLDKQPARARELEAAEQARRERKARKQDQEELDLSEAEGDEGEDEEAASA